MEKDEKVPMDPGFDVHLAIENLRKIIVRIDNLPNDCDALQAAEHRHDVREHTDNFMASIAVEVYGRPDSFCKFPSSSFRRGNALCGFAPRSKTFYISSHRRSHRARHLPRNTRYELSRQSIVSEKIFDTRKCKACGAATVILLLDDFLNQQDAYRANHNLAETAAELLRNLRPDTEKYSVVNKKYKPVAAKIHEQTNLYFDGKHDHQHCCEDPRLALDYLRLSQTILEDITTTAKKEAFYEEISRQPGLRSVRRLLSEAEQILHEHGFRDSEITKIIPDNSGAIGRIERIQNRRSRLLKRLSK